MGLGEMGEACELLISTGYEVHGWSKSKKEIQGVPTFPLGVGYFSIEDQHLGLFASFNQRNGRNP